MSVLGRDKEGSKFRELTKDGEYFAIGEVFRLISNTNNDLFETVYFDSNTIYKYCHGCDFESICKERLIPGVPFLPVPACAPGYRLDGRHVHFKKI